MTELLILDKERWMRGSPVGSNTRLLDYNGKMCCLGFCMAQNRFPACDLMDTSEPSQAVIGLRGMGSCPEYLVYGSKEELSSSKIEEGTVSFNDTSFTCDAMSVNDDSLTSDEQKVCALNKLFKEVGVEVVLVDTPEQCEALGGLPANFAKDLIK